MAAGSEDFFGTDFAWILFRILFFGNRFLGDRFFGKPGERWLRDWVGDAGWNECGWSSALERLAQLSGAHEFCRLWRTGDTTTHWKLPLWNSAMGMVERRAVTRKVMRELQKQGAVGGGCGGSVGRGRLEHPEQSVEPARCFR